MISRTWFTASSFVALLVACAGPTASTTGTQASGSEGPAGSASPQGSGSGSGSGKHAPVKPLLEDEEILARVKGDFTACYEKGKKATPEMGDGKILLLAHVDEAGKTTCIVPMEDSGLTQEVEDCMRTRLTRETYPASGEHWSFELPIVVRGGAVGLGAEPTGPVIADIDSHGLPDASSVVDALLPKFSECVQPLRAKSNLRVIHVGARVEADGRVGCALATSRSRLSRKVRECATQVLAGAHFKPPKGGYGLIAIPVKVLGATPASK